MATEVEVIVFEQPQGDVRGLVNAFVALEKKPRCRIAHATLMVGKKPDVVVEIPKRISVDDVLAVMDGLEAFVIKLKQTECPDPSTAYTLTMDDGVEVTRIHEADKKYGLFTVADFDKSRLSSNDGFGVWATATHESDMRARETARPDWATHVLWFNN